MRQTPSSKLKRNEFSEQRLFADAITLGDFWLSGTDLGHEGKFVWMSTGRPVTVNKWIPGEPDHSQICDGGQKKHCMKIDRFYNRAMNNFCCEKWLNYVCERRNINQ